VGGWSTRTCR